MRYVPGSASTAAATSSSSRWRGATSIAEYERAVRGRRRARGPRRPRHLQRHQRACWPRPAPSAGDWLLVNVAADYASIAILRGQRPDLLPQPRADAEGDAGRSRAPDGDVLRGSAAAAAASRASCWPAPRSAGAEQAERMRRSLEERLGGRSSPSTPRPPRRCADRIGAARRCSTRSRRSSACCCASVADGRRTGGVMLRTNLSTRPFYNERAVHLVARPRGAGRGRADGRQPASASCASRGRTRSWRTHARRGDGRTS